VGELKAMLRGSSRQRIGGPIAATAAAMLLLASTAACTRSSQRGNGAGDPAGGVAPRATAPIVASIRAEPRSFNRYVARDLTSDVISHLTQAALVRVDRTTGRLVPELAESWTLESDQATYRIKLRTGLRFSDGVPFTADDVVFSFDAIYDDRVGSVFADSLMVRGKPLTVTADSSETVTIRFPVPFAPGLRLLDGVPILPRHRLQAALQSGTFRASWGPQTRPDDLAGLGPYQLEKYVPGQRLLFTRNRFHWQDEEARRQHAADRIELEIVPDQNAEALGLESGRVDFTQSEIRPADFAAFQRAAAAGRVVMHDLGVGTDGDLLWFNLAPRPGDPRSRWLQHADLRRAISDAVDREAFVNTVYLGAAVPAYGVVSPGNAAWYQPAAPAVHDRETSTRLLDGLGLSLRDRGGIRTDAAGAPARFTLVTQSGNTALERGAVFVRDALRGVGVEVDVVLLEVNALIARITSGDYDAAYFRLLTTDTDPALNLDFWLSSGSAHVWHPEQARPGTGWERHIDELMLEMSSTLDVERRRRLFAEVQRIWAGELPALCFAFPRAWVVVNPRIRNATPALFRPPVLWNPAMLGAG
jgi:peptide/nickel transport system substrate-binding protein